jgi:hypothetical protein
MYLCRMPLAPRQPLLNVASEDFGRRGNLFTMARFIAESTAGNDIASDHTTAVLGAGSAGR